ncbi:MAG: D-aminoacylase [Nitriliruptoraceae bacterium]
MDADILFRNTTLVDGSGAEPRPADVAVQDGRIAAIGDLGDVSAATIIDVAGKVLAPGFIDIHTHSDVSMVFDPAGESKAFQGVTTEVPGNCGRSVFPIEPSRREQLADYLAGSVDERLQLDWTDFNGYADLVNAAAPSINIAPLVGHHAIRIAALGLDNRDATPDELAHMQRLVAESLDQGAFGLSTGLTIAPGMYGSEEEVAALVAVVADRDAMYATHARMWVAEGFASVEEAIRVCEASGARLQYSHAAINEPDKWGRADDMIDLFVQARERGVDAAFDVYPYIASSSGILQYLPEWVQDGGTQAMRDRLADPAARRRAEADTLKGWFGGIPWYWDRFVFVTGAPGYEWIVGLTIEEAAERQGVPPETFTLEVSLAHGNAIKVVLFYRLEEDVQAFLAHDLATIGSDGSAISMDQGDSKPHPRNFGTYPRILGSYVRDQGLLTLPQAVQKMTSQVAERLQISDRGLVREGLVADLVVFDADEVIDRATFEEPAQTPQGISHVAVNGVLVVDDHQHTGARPGQVLRR